MGVGGGYGGWGSGWGEREERDGVLEGKRGVEMACDGLMIGLRSSDGLKTSDKGENRFTFAMGLVITWDEVRGWKELRV